MMIQALDRAGMWVGERLRAFGVKRALMAALGGLLLVGIVCVVALLAGAGVTVWAWLR